MEQGRLQRLPPEGGVADVDMHLLWMADRKFSAAEAAFLEALHRFIDVRYPETVRKLFASELKHGLSCSRPQRM